MTTDSARRTFAWAFGLTLALKLALAAVFPFGPFLLDRSLRRAESLCNSLCRHSRRPRGSGRKAAPEPDAAAPEAAKQLLDFLTGPTARPVLAAQGMEPAR